MKLAFEYPPPEIDYEETMKDFKEIKSNETKTETTTKKQETSREEQATVNKGWNINEDYLNY